jgi:cbb3-type cytochrome oxidase cytochrome c subunit
MALMSLSTKYVKLLVGFAVVLLVMTGVVFLVEGELSRPWKKIQRQFNKTDKKLTLEEVKQVQQLPDGEEKNKKLGMLDKRLDGIKSRGTGIKQLWLTDFDITDRCMNCHAGAEYPRFADVDQPLTTHPGKHIAPDRHGVEQYGCVICHAGQGVALDVHEAHGESHNWVEPFLPGTRAESSCVGCHPMTTTVAEKAELADAPVFSKGRSLYLENNCLGCHLLQDNVRSESIGPILTKLATKTNSGWTRNWVKNPKGYLSQTVMPDFELPDDEIMAMTAYLFSLSKPESADAAARSKMEMADLAVLGAKKLDDLGCLGCHSVDGKDEGFGPDLSRVGEKMTPEWLYAWIKDPKKYWPETAMPNLRVPDEDAQLLTAYLVSLKKEEASSSELDASAELVEKGLVLVRDKGCTGCHKIGEFALGYNAPAHDGIGVKRVDELVFAETDIPHTLSDWLTLKIKNPRAFNTEDMPTLMPKFGFNDEQTEALLTFLLSIREFNIPGDYIKVLVDPVAPNVHGELIVEQNNCRGCHRIGDAGGTIGPDLGFEGERVNPEWLVDFLQKPDKIRPGGIEPTRMPTFDFAADQAETLAAFFADANKVAYPHYMPEKKEITEADTEEAWKFFWQTFSCQSCHAWKGEGGIIGPDQSDLGNRLRGEWVAKWLKNPQAFIPDIQMPNFELYPDEAEKLSNLLMGFADISPGVWHQIKKRWEDEQLLKQAQQMGGN